MKGETRVVQAARALGELSLQHEEGEFLGAEDDLLARLGVSRPTLRQAARIAENDRLVDVRRGIRGGIYAARPDAADAIRTITRYLRLKGATARDVMALGHLVAEEAAGLAAHCTDPALRSRVRDFADTIDFNTSAGAVFRSEMELGRLLAEMSGNPALGVMTAIGQSFGSDEHGIVLFGDSTGRDEARMLQADLCHALLKGDSEIARLMMRRRARAMARWLDKAEGDTGPEQQGHGTDDIRERKHECGGLSNSH